MTSLPVPSSSRPHHFRPRVRRCAERRRSGGRSRRTNTSILMTISAPPGDRNPHFRCQPMRKPYGWGRVLSRFMDRKILPQLPQPEFIIADLAIEPQKLIELSRAEVNSGTKKQGKQLNWLWVPKFPLKFGGQWQPMQQQSNVYKLVRF